jgi:hypothetical protein
MHDTRPLPPLTLALSLCLALGACDKDDDDDATASGDSKSDDNGDDDSGDDDSGTAMGEEAGSAGGTADDAATTGGITIPPECEALCDCIGGLGGDPLSCGSACGGAIVDADPDDHAQCQAYVAMAAYADCSPECESFPSGG